MFKPVKPLTLDATVDPNKLMQAFAEVLTKAVAENIQKTQTVGAPVGPYVHGPGGIFGVRGLEREVISTHTQITGSLGEMIPIRGSNTLNPLFPYITGFVRSDQQEKNAVCDDPYDAAPFKTCIQTTVFGRKEFASRQLEINHVGQSNTRGEFFDLVLENDPLVQQMGGLMQGFTGFGSADSVLAGREMVARMLEMAVAFQRWFCPQVYVGNPANSRAGGGYKEFPGLDLLIGTNKIDALSGVACPSLYSDVKDFGYRQVSSTTDPDIYRTLSTMMYILETRAMQNDMSPVDFRLVMRPQLFFELTRFWPLVYNTEGAMGIANVTNNVDLREMIAIRDAMRQGQYLTINSKQYKVILDPCIPEDNRADNAAIPIGGFASDIYIVPFSARGGQIRTLYWEYYDYQNGPMQAVTDSRAGNFFWSDGGVFLWHLKPPDNWCIEVIAKTEPRLILRTPQLAGRLQNVAYVPLQHVNDVLPSQDYWVNGGVATGRPAPSPFSEWNPGGPGFTN
jgi:hypothetical protein